MASAPDPKLTEASLPLNPEGAVYHLAVNQKQISHLILLVGDPGRAEKIAERYLQKPLETYQSHRGLVTITGRTKELVLGDKGMRLTVSTSGMGTPSLEIVIGELIALNEIKFPERRRYGKPLHVLKVIRVGTSGAVQKVTKLGTAIISQYAIGADNTGLFYNIPAPDEICIDLEQQSLAKINAATDPASRFAGRIIPYASKAHPRVVTALVQAAEELRLQKKASEPLHKLGITVSNAGFFANQGRDIHRVGITVPNIDSVLGSISVPSLNLKVENLEMEASFLLHILSGLGYQSGVVCAAIANRVEQTFAQDMETATWDAIEIGFRALVILRKEELAMKPKM